MSASSVAQWARSRESGCRWQFRLLLWLALHAPAWLGGTLVWLIALVFAAQRGRPTTQASAAYLRRVTGTRAPSRRSTWTVCGS